MFATASYGVVDANTGEVSLASAGHPSPIAKIAGKIEVVKFEKGAKGPALGMLPGMPYGEVVLPLADLEGLWCFTDGVFEAQNSSGEEYGVERMIGLLSSESGSRIVEVVEAARRFSGDGAFDDDVCLLELEVSRKA
jgi:sigma-B regulation protein RsbU (phosphoserine phosphatase)